MLNYQIIQGNVFDTLPTIPRKSIDCAVTSPPYWMLRSYLPKGHELKQFEIGQEPTPQAFIENQVKVFRLLRDALADHGTLWLNMGDTYSHSAGKRKPTDKYGAKQKTNGFAGTTESASVEGLDSGNLCLIPQRLAIALQDDGWIVRSVVVWHKPAPMPTSVSGWMWRRCLVKTQTQKPNGAKYQESGNRTARTRKEMENHPDVADITTQWKECNGCKKCDKTGGYVLRKGSWRPTSSWEPVLMLAKTSDYFCDGESVKTLAAESTISRDQYTRILDDPDEQYAVAHDHETSSDTANLRDVWRQKLDEMSREELIELIEAGRDSSLPDLWTIPAQPLKQKHYAAFPGALVEKCLRAGTSSHGYCSICGMPWCRIVVKGDPINRPDNPNEVMPYTAESGHSNSTGATTLHKIVETKTLGYRQSCTCPANDPRPGRVLDPFSGSGRTGIVARRLGLDYIGCELNPEYVAMSTKLIKSDAPLFS